MNGSEIGSLQEEWIFWGEDVKFCLSYPRLEMFIKHGIRDAKQTVGYNCKYKIREQI